VIVEDSCVHCGTLLRGHAQPTAICLPCWIEYVRTHPEQPPITDDDFSAALQQLSDDA